MKSQPNAKGGMYVLNEDIDMKAKVAAMARKLEELEMKKVQEVQAMPCSIFQSYEHLVEECLTIPAVREMLLIKQMLLVNSSPITMLHMARCHLIHPLLQAMPFDSGLDECYQ
ncbi:hypothetical protein CK203_068920 [Vitis vinifera]|uniref:Uncharacterized protein n=1 Tax=Vitis vinifera TaxID=29760 RepID=A0A438F0N0_VITVI|nr:hypothetical protein CK203_068920 [Vitis vinifera]